MSLYTGSSPPLVGLRDELRDARQMCAWKRRFVVQFLWSGPSPTEPGSASARLWPCHCCRSASSGRTSWSPWCLRPVRKGAPGRAVVALMGPQGGKGVLILSDSLNHASIVEGVKQCGATVKPFAHNDMPDLQRMLHTATTKGQAAFAKKKAGGAAQSSSSPGRDRRRRPLAQDHRCCRGHLQHGGRVLQPARGRGAEEEVRRLYLDEAYLDEAHSDQRVAGRWLEHACRVLVEPVYKWSMAHWSCRSPAGRGENRTVSRGSMTHAPRMDMRGRVVLKTKSSGRAQVFLCSITNNSSNYYSTIVQRCLKDPTSVV